MTKCLSLKPLFPAALLCSQLDRLYCYNRLGVLEAFSSYSPNSALVRPADMAVIRVNPAVIVEIQNDAPEISTVRTEALGYRTQCSEYTPSTPPR